MSDVTSSVEFLKGHMAVFPAFFNRLSEERLLWRPGPDKWSAKEILGHLIDSAVHYLAGSASYAQDELVRVNRYQSLPLPHLLGLWESLNRQILFVQGDGFCDYVAHLEHHLSQIYERR